MFCQTCGVFAHSIPSSFQTWQAKNAGSSSTAPTTFPKQTSIWTYFPAHDQPRKKTRTISISALSPHTVSPRPYHLPTRADLVLPLHLHEMKPLTPTQAYHEKLREYHPDKRPESRGDTGARAAWIESWTSWIRQVSCELEFQGHASSFGRLVHSSGEHVGESHALRLCARSIQDQEKRDAYDALWHKKRTVIHCPEPSCLWFRIQNEFRKCLIFLLFAPSRFSLLAVNFCFFSLTRDWIFIAPS